MLCILPAPLPDRGGHPQVPPVRRAALLPSGTRQVPASAEGLGRVSPRPRLLAGSGLSDGTLPLPQLQ